MTVGDFMKELRVFPPEFPVFLCLDPEECSVAQPGEIVMNLVNPQLARTVPDDDETEVPPGFIDSVVVYTRQA
ncbi:MAG: hypothetical protein WD278_13700 [Pirellulales bacterium]